MSYAIRTQQVSSIPVAVVRRRVGPSELSNVVPEGCGLVWRVLKAADVKGAGRHVALYRDAGAGLIDVEIGVEVASPFSGSDEVAGSSTPAGNVATVTHLGPYGELGSAHQAIWDWSTAQGRPMAGVRWELYGHWMDEWISDPSKIRTDIFYLLAG